MDLWQGIARLRRRPLGLALTAALAIGLALLGWVSTRPSYTASQGQLVQVVKPAAGSGTSSYDLGLIATMIAQNTAGAAGANPGTVTATNTIVNPPLALPLISMTAISDSAADTTALLTSAQRSNEAFLQTLTQGAENATGQLRLVSTVENPVPTESRQPRIRAAGAGFILGLLGGTLLLIVIDTASRRRTTGSHEHRNTARD